MEYLQHLHCPSCSGTLQATDKKVACNSCQEVFPLIDDVPWLFEKPGESLAGWRVRFNALLGSIKNEEEQLKAGLKEQGNSELTSRRLKKVLQAKVEQRKLLTDLMSPLVKEPAGNPDLYQGMQLRDTAGQSIGGYYTNIHRDWAWNTDENQLCAKIVNDLISTCTGVKRILILGAGAGRLAWDLHLAQKPELTVALDINPLMVLAARKITKGRNLKLYEFPLAPRTLDDHAVLQTCRPPGETPDNLHFILADGLHPPVKPGAFDLILTPWFIDIIPTKLKETAAIINQALAKGGHWVNFGSLAFNHADPAANYSSEEATEVINTSGFSISKISRNRIPYMQSPHSAHGRVEETVAFAAVKTTGVSCATEKVSIPPWLNNFSQTIPQDRVFSTSHMIYSIYAEVVGQIDGKTSINDIARTFGPKHGLPPDEAAASVRNFLVRMLDSAARGVNF